MTPLRCANAPSMAKSFLRLAHRSCYYSTSTTALHSSAAPLEFLVPRSALRITSSSTRGHTSGLRMPQPLMPATPVRNTPSRYFSVSSSKRATVCVQNSIKDEDGKEMMLEITPRAAKRLSDIMTKDANPNLALRISVESGGCHGFQYLMSLVTLPEKGTPQWSEVVNEDDSIFEFATDEADSSAPSPETPRIILDEPSLDLLKGSKVDFTMELIGSQFKIVDNPYATSSCGCGTSFDIKM